MRKFNYVLKGSCLIFMFMLAACSHHGEHKQPTSMSKKEASQKEKDDGDGPPEKDIDVTHIPNATPKVEPLSRYGNPHRYEVFGIHYHTLPHSSGYAAEGTASWYGRKFHGQRTSSGEPYDMFGMTAAHRSLPLPTYAKVKNLNNGREVIVKINDRGPFVKDRLIDLSYAAAKKLGIHATGTGKVRITAIDPVAWHKQKNKDSTLARVSKRGSANSKVTPQKQPVQLAKSDKSLSSKPTKDLAKKPTAKNVKNTNIAKADKQLYLQLGTFNKKSNAQQLADKASTLAQAIQHANVHILPSKSNNKDSFKVRIGPLKSEKEAQTLQKKLIALNGTGKSKVVYE